ncbi:MAG: ATP-binding protein [Pseudonocardia sp.]
MTTRTELFELLRNGENSGVEFKCDTLEARSLACEIVALTNLSGGRILLGVETDGTVVGSTRPNLEEWVMQACRDKVRPGVIPYIEIVRDVMPGRDVAIVEVSRGYALHALWHNNHRTYFVQVGSTNREVNEAELARLVRQRGSLRTELQPVSGTSSANLDGRRLVDYFNRIRGQILPVDLEQRERLLVNTEFVTSDGPATVAGMALFSVEATRFLPHAGISAAAYPGSEKDYTAVERTQLRGPMTALQGTGGLVEAGLVEQAWAFVARTAGGRSIIVDGARRVDSPAYPEEVIREVIVNAVVHRDYLLTSSDIELSVYADRLEVISPGRLPNGITVESIRDGARAARNQLLKDVMRDYNYMEHMGMGVPRTIIAGMRAHNGTEPEFEEDHERLTVRLRR